MSEVKMTLYDIDARIYELTEKMIDDATGEVNEEVYEELEQLGMEREQKIEGCLLVIKNLTSQVDGIKAEMDSLKKRMDAKMNRIQSVSRYVNNSLKGEKFETARACASYRKSQSVEIIDEDLVPDELCRFETKRKPQKQDIKKMLKGGEFVPGCVLKESNNLIIK